MDVGEAVAAAAVTEWAAAAAKVVAAAAELAANTAARAAAVAAMESPLALVAAVATFGRVGGSGGGGTSGWACGRICVLGFASQLVVRLSPRVFLGQASVRTTRPKVRKSRSFAQFCSLGHSPPQSWALRSPSS